MAKKPRKPRLEQYEAFKEASGWYLAAWRDKRGLTLEELAEDVGTSKGVVSDMETGAKRSTGALAQRFNATWLKKFSDALEVTEGFLIQVNPFTADETHDLGGKLERLGDADRKVVEDLIDRLLAKG
jgi:transcriptional regulator with XRE-family HTH domain